MRIALVSDSHLSARAPECVSNWHAARCAIEQLAPDVTVHLGDITLDGQVRSEELTFARDLLHAWPTHLRCLPGNHDMGDASGDLPLDARLLGAYREVFGQDRWMVETGGWKLLGINAQLLGTDSDEESALWDWIDQQTRPTKRHVHTGLFLHRPLFRPLPGENTRKGRYVCREATERLLDGPLKSTLRLVASGHTHQFHDVSDAGVRHLWIPSTAFVLPDDMQARVGEKVVGIGLIHLNDQEASFDLWCPNGLIRHDLPNLQFFRGMSVSAATR